MVELFIRFILCVFRELMLLCVFASFPFGFEDGMLDVIASVFF